MNPDKKYLVSAQERRDLLKHMLSDRNDSNIQVEGSFAAEVIFV